MTEPNIKITLSPIYFTSVVHHFLHCPYRPQRAVDVHHEGHDEQQHNEQLRHVEDGMKIRGSLFDHLPDFQYGHDDDENDAGDLYQQGHHSTSPAVPVQLYSFYGMRIDTVTDCRKFH